VIVLLDGCQKRQGVYFRGQFIQRILNRQQSCIGFLVILKDLGIQKQTLPVLPVAHDAAVGKQPILHNGLGIGAEPPLFGVVGGCGLTKQYAAFSVQVIIFKTKYRFIYLHKVVDRPVDDS